MNKIFIWVLVVPFIFFSCSNDKSKSGETLLKSVDPVQGELESKPVVNTETYEKIFKKIDLANDLKIRSRIGVLYYLNKPAHHLALIDFITSRGGDVLFESETFGYLEASIDLLGIRELINTKGFLLGLNDKSFLKIEFDEDFSFENKPIPLPNEKEENTNLNGPVHSAGFGAHVESFRKKVAEDLSLQVSDIEGQGTLASIFDSGLDFSRTDVFGERLKKIIVGDENLWTPVTMNLKEFLSLEGKSLDFIPEGLEDVQDFSTLRFHYLSQKDYYHYLAEDENDSDDLNGSGDKKDRVAVAVYKSHGEIYAKFRPHPKMAFGEGVKDFNKAFEEGSPQIIDLYTGKFYKRDLLNPGTSAIGVTFKEKNNIIYASFTGTNPHGQHGIANLHMVGGDYLSGPDGVRFRGVAPKTHFLVASTWQSAVYGQSWLSLARTILKSAEEGADVIDLDIYTPGTREGSDMLTNLLCRVTNLSNSVPVVAAHNYGPLNNTVQNMAQSPCVITVGAANSFAEMKTDPRKGINPKLKEEDEILTTIYSGRGFALNGELKPDIISPAYAYTAYGENFVRFGGTSGATPTTAGSILLLKQAARLIGMELNFYQVKNLLQSGSKEPNQPRDGYGYINLLKSWELLKKWQTKLYPFALKKDYGGVTNFEFKTLPEQRTYTFSLYRERIKGTYFAPVPMEIEVVYPQGGTAGAKKWIKLVDPYTGSKVDKIKVDAPMPGEKESLNFIIDLNNEEYSEMEAGDYIAFIKGKRISFDGDRFIDFVIPISLQKGFLLNQEKDFKTDPLFYLDYKIFPLKVNKNDRVYLKMSTKCEGKKLADNAEDPLFLLVDPLESYPHSHLISNTYSPFSTANTPYVFTAEKELVYFAVARYRLGNCDGPISASIEAQKIDIGIDLLKSKIELNDENKVIKNFLKISNKNGMEKKGNEHWKIKFKNLHLRGQTTLSNNECLKMPKGILGISGSLVGDKQFYSILSKGNSVEDPNAKTIATNLDMQTAYGGGLQTYSEKDSLKSSDAREGDIICFHSVSETAELKLSLIIGLDGKNFIENPEKEFLENESFLVHEDVREEVSIKVAKDLLDGLPTNLKYSLGFTLAISSDFEILSIPQYFEL